MVNVSTTTTTIYRALRRFEVGGRWSVDPSGGGRKTWIAGRIVQIGDSIPEAATWPSISTWINGGYIEAIKAGTVVVATAASADVTKAVADVDETKMPRRVKTR